MNVWSDGDTVKLSGMTGTLILGEAPSSAGQLPLRSVSCKKRLVADHGFDGWPDQNGWDVANVYDTPRRRTADGRGFRFYPRTAARTLDLDVLWRYERVVVLGARVWEALTLALADNEEAEFPDPPRWFDIVRWGPTALRWPHPSGLNHYWNDPIDRERAYEVFRAFVGLQAR